MQDDEKLISARALKEMTQDGTSAEQMRLWMETGKLKSVSVGKSGKCRKTTLKWYREFKEAQ